MLDEAALYGRYTLGNLLRAVSRPWRQWSVSPDIVTTIFGCTFGDSGWHHIRCTLREYDADRALPARNSTLWKFLSRFCPASISVLAGVADERPLPLFEYPWGNFSGAYETGKKDPLRSRFCGPSEPSFIQQEFDRTIALYESMQRTGYRPTTYPNSHIGGTWLLAEDGSRRFVVMQGNHRMAILAHLGLRSIDVRSIAQARSVVRERDLVSWEHVRSGRCSRRHARSVFRYFFENAGWQVARMVG